MRKVGILGSLSAHQPGGSAASTNAVAVAAHAYCGWIRDNMEIWTKGTGGSYSPHRSNVGTASQHVNRDLYNRYPRL